MKTLEKNLQSESYEINKALHEAQALILQSNKKHKRSKFFLFIALILFCCIAIFFSTIFAFLNLKSNKIINGISVYGIDLSGLTVDEAKETLNSYITSKSEKVITFNHNDFSGSVNLSQLNININFEDAVNSAYSIGRSNNFFKNNYDILSTRISKTNIIPNISFDTDIFYSLVEVINLNLPDHFLDPNYYIEGSNLIIVNGKDGITTDSKALFNVLLSELKKGLDSDISIDLPVNNVTPKSIDIDAIHNEIYKTPTDAYYLTNPYVVYPSSNGLDFSISLDDVKTTLKTYQEQYSIPLKTLYPNVFTNDIGMEAFPDLLSEFSTSFKSSNYGRSTNIELAASKINDVVLMPGETFSFNQTVGQRTAAAGFKEAAAYSEGQVVQEVGGGICQVSSTLYNAVLYANLEITERSNHYFNPGYVKAGLDATVSWGGPDFRFTNNRDYPIKIIADTSGKIVHISIHGLHRDSDYHVELQTENLSSISPQTVYKYSHSLPSGSRKTTSWGSPGCKTITYKILYDKNWAFVSKTQISRDVYNAHDTIVEVGI